MNIVPRVPIHFLCLLLRRHCSDIKRRITKVRITKKGVNCTSNPIKGKSFAILIPSIIVPPTSYIARDKILKEGIIIARKNSHNTNTYKTEIIGITITFSIIDSAENQEK